MKIRPLLFAAAFIVPSLALAQGGGIEAEIGLPGMPSMNLNVRVNDGTTSAEGHASAHAEERGDGFRITWDTDPEGGTWFKVVEPEGFVVTVRNDRGVVKAEGRVPVSFRARGQRYYEVEVHAGETSFVKKFEAKPGMIAQVFVAPPAKVVVQHTVVTQPVVTREVVVQPVAARPVEASPCGSEGDFQSVSEAIGSEDFSDGKLRVLEDAASSRRFCVDQTVRLLGMFDFGSDKLKALQIVAPGLTDRQNKFKIYKAFTFDSERDEARRILD